VQVALGVCAVLVFLFAVTVVTVPDEWCQFTLIHNLLFSRTVDMVRGRPGGWFSNILVLPDLHAVDLAAYKKSEEEDSTTISLRGRDLNGAVLIRADLRSADFTGASLRKARFDDATLTRARFGCGDKTEESCADLEGASFRGARVERSSFERANLRGADFEQASLQGASFDGADLRAAYFDGARLQGSTFVTARLEAAWLSHASLQGASFLAADMEVAAIFDASLQGANFEAAKLQGASLADDNMTAASFDLASVWRSDISKAVTKDAQMPDLNHVEEPELCSQPICQPDPKAFDELLQSEKQHTSGLIQTMVSGKLIELYPGVTTAISKSSKEKWKAAIAAPQPSAHEYQQALATELEKVACDSSDPPFVIDGLIDNGRLAATGTEVAKLIDAFSDEKKCPGARGLLISEKDKLRGILQNANEPQQQVND
jgi:uncharacterized protein YjbI with pentapeptide repeats